MNQPVAPNQPLTVTFEAQVWNAVIAAMGKAVYEQVAPLIQALTEQLQNQAVPVAPNGHLKESSLDAIQ